MLNASHKFALAHLNYYLQALVLIILATSRAYGVTHWKITESGRVEADEDSAYSLLRPYDLAAFLRQQNRVERLNVLREIIVSKESLAKREATSTKNSVADYQENFYKSDKDCLKAGQQLTKFSFYETHLTSWNAEGLHLPNELNTIKKKDVKVFKKPYCGWINLPFSMRTFNHLESIQSKENITMLPEKDIMTNILVEYSSEEFYGHLLHKSLLINSSSWVYLSMAADYFRLKGDFSNAVKCLQRAIYHSPLQSQNIPMLSLSNMLHKLHFLNDSLAVALSSLSYESEKAPFAYYIGNIYVTLGKLNIALDWYTKAYNLDPDFRHAYLKKHATSCHIKLEAYLEEQHENLQKKLEELKEYQHYSDEYFHLTSKLESEKSSANRKEFTKKFYKSYMANTVSNICDWSPNNIMHHNSTRSYDEKKELLICRELPIYLTSLLIDEENGHILKDYISNPTNIETNDYDYLSELNKQDTCSNSDECIKMHRDNSNNSKQSSTKKNHNKLRGKVSKASEESSSASAIKESSELHMKIVNEKLINNRIKPPSSSSSSSSSDIIINKNFEIKENNDLYSNTVF